MDKGLPDTKPFAPFEWMLAMRYLRARRREGFISVISLFSFLGILLGVATLIVVMSVLNGFRAELLDKMGIAPRELLRARATAYKELGLATSGHSDLELIELMAEDPELIQRPIAEKGGKAVLCRPYDRILEIL